VKKGRGGVRRQQPAVSNNKWLTNQQLQQQQRGDHQQQNTYQLNGRKTTTTKKFMAQPRANVSYLALIANDIFRSNLPSYFRHTFLSIPDTSWIGRGANFKWAEKM
jgi:hypothetical protein